MDSPLARLLLKKQLGDEVCLEKPDGSEVWYEITAIEYTQ
jgi:transcription elongation factor GreB